MWSKAKARDHDILNIQTVPSTFLSAFTSPRHLSLGSVVLPANALHQTAAGSGLPRGNDLKGVEDFYHLEAKARIWP